MPPSQQPKQRTLEQVAEDVAQYSPAAFDFVEEGLRYAVHHIHGTKAKDPEANRHVSGQQLCDGLRQLALLKWGMLARTVLRRWNVTSTLDFGRIVFALIEAGQMQKTDEDSVEDFKDVFEFKRAFETSYRIPAES
jgi:uncharacterized repeat protein (TIGR04138 family)